MKALEILLRVLEYFFTTLLQKKAQDERNKLEENPADWFGDHFDGMHSGTDKSNQTDTADNSKT